MGVFKFFFRLDLFLLSLLLILFWAGSCNVLGPSDKSDNTDSSKLHGTQIPTTIGEGTGGPAILLGQIQNNQQEAILNSHLFVFNPLDYVDTLASVMVTSSDGSFKITQLPVGPVDIIVTAPEYFTEKEAERLLVEGDNTLLAILQSDEPYSIHLDIISGGQGEVPRYTADEVSVKFKDEAIDSVSANNILQGYGCSIESILTIADFPRPLFTGIIPDDKTVPKMVMLLSFDEQIYAVGPKFLYYTAP